MHQHNSKWDVSRKASAAACSAALERLKQQNKIKAARKLTSNNQFPMSMPSTTSNSCILHINFPTQNHDSKVVLFNHGTANFIKVNADQAAPKRYFVTRRVEKRQRMNSDSDNEDRNVGSM
jgi:hypothetical protein